MMTTQIYVTRNGQQEGPYSKEQVQSFLADGTIQPTDLVWQEGMAEWTPASQLFGIPPNMPKPPTPGRTQGPLEVKTDVKQGAIIGGAVCFALGIVFMFMTLWSFFIYGPLFLASFILSIVAMAQKRVVSGVSLLLLTLLVPTILWLVLATKRTAEVVKELNKQNAVQATPSNGETSKETSATGSETEQPTKKTSQYPALDEKNGFREYKLGANLNEFKNLKPPRKVGESEWYDVENFDPKLGSAEISGIRLIFEAGLLREIDVLARGKINIAALRETLIQAYGQASKQIIGDNLVWAGERVHLRFRKNNFGESASADFESKEVEAKIKVGIEEKAKEAASEGAKNL